MSQPSQDSSLAEKHFGTTDRSSSTSASITTKTSTPTYPPPRELDAAIGLAPHSKHSTHKTPPSATTKSPPPSLGSTAPGHPTAPTSPRRHHHAYHTHSSSAAVDGELFGAFPELAIGGADDVPQRIQRTDPPPQSTSSPCPRQLVRRPHRRSDEHHLPKPIPFGADPTMQTSPSLTQSSPLRPPTFEQIEHAAPDQSGAASCIRHQDEPRPRSCRLRSEPPRPRQHNSDTDPKIPIRTPIPTDAPTPLRNTPPPLPRHPSTPPRNRLSGASTKTHHPFVPSRLRVRQTLQSHESPRPRRFTPPRPRTHALARTKHNRSRRKKTHQKTDTQNALQTSTTYRPILVRSTAFNSPEETSIFRKHEYHSPTITYKSCQKVGTP